MFFALLFKRLFLVDNTQTYLYLPNSVLYMDDFLVLKQQAIREVRLADHMLTMTYPLLKDPKLLLAILENLFLASSHAMSALLSFERAWKRIPAFQDTFESKFHIFKQKVVPRYQIDMKWLRFIAELKEALEDHRQASTEFSRKGMFVMANEEYRLRTLSVDDLKYYLRLTKDFVHYVLQLIRTG